jgi:alkylated DNA repair dioxygenase AlkB
MENSSLTGVSGQIELESLESQETNMSKVIISDSTYKSNFLHFDDATELFCILNTEITYIPRSEMTFSIFGKTLELPRDKCFYGKVEADGDYPAYRYDRDLTKVPVVQDWNTIPLLADCASLISESEGQEVNHLVINRYLDGGDHIGYHQDKVRDFVENSAVKTVSLGGTRRLRF